MDQDDARLLTPTLIKAARALLSMDQEGLAEASGLSRKTISLIEASSETPSDPRRIAAMIEVRRALEKLGAEFTFSGKRHGEGVKLRV